VLHFKLELAYINAIIVSKQQKVYGMYKNSIKILGAYGTRAKDFGTTSFMLNPTTVIDAGNLLNSLAADSLHVEHIYLTHSHLDHISDIAYIIDNYFTQRKKLSILWVCLKRFKQ
jgi:glyoxylase-like metal-dependent hydrolase (beta-lactamase superfamily II)